MSTPPALTQAEIDRENRRREIFAARSAARQRLVERLEDEDAPRHSRRLAACGEILHLVCTCCGQTRGAAKRCDLKWCPSCAPRLAHDKVTKYGPVVNDFASPLFVTFTTRNFDARSKKTTGMREVVRAFRRLRSQRWWRRSVAGGVASFEMTRRNKGWHPHVHVLLDSGWFAATITRPPLNCPAKEWKRIATLACREIADQWSLALGGRRGSVHVRKIRVRDGETIADSLKEVMKYSVTAESLEAVTGKVSLLLDELAVTRNLVGFGSAYRHPSLAKAKREGLPCTGCGELKTMMPEELVRACSQRAAASVTVRTNAERIAAGARQRSML